MNAEEKKQRIRERLKMTQAEKWLTKIPTKPGAATLSNVPFNEQLRHRNNPRIG